MQFDMVGLQQAQVTGSILFVDVIRWIAIRTFTPLEKCAALELKLYCYDNSKHTFYYSVLYYDVTTIHKNVYHANNLNRTLFGLFGSDIKKKCSLKFSSHWNYTQY